MKIVKNDFSIDVFISFIISLTPYCETRDYNDKCQDHTLDKLSSCDRPCRILDHWPVVHHRTTLHSVACDAISHEHLSVLAVEDINK